MSNIEHNSEKFGYIDLETLTGVQEALSKLGYDLGEVDGKDGPKTQNAVRQFQAFASIKVDGIAGTQTRLALKGELAQKAEE